MTTLSALIFKSHSAYLFHIGDSRVYRLRGGELEQVSRDHAMAISDQQSYLTRAMGLDLCLDVDYQQLELEAGDVYVLSTDGVHDFVADPDIAGLLAQADDFEAAAAGLIELALAQGSDDNVSCQLLRVDSLPDSQVDDMVSRLTQLPFPPFLSVGMELDGYRIERELHASSRSQLYLVRDVASGKNYCMKTPSVNFEDDPAYIERFILEAWIGRRVNNAHVVRIVESPRPRSCLYYLMEYVDGLSLAQWIRENPKPAVQEVVYLVDRHGVVRIVDFGACYAPGIAEIAVPIEREVALGTRSYSAPEYQVKRRPGPQADIFSLAVVTFEMLTGELPFGGALENCTSPEQFLRTTYVAAYRINPLVPVWIDGALRKALRYQPQRRHQEVSELVYELQHPNSKYLERGLQPLLQRDPVLAWKLLAGTLAVTQLLSILWMLR